MGTGSFVRPGHRAELRQLVDLHARCAPGDTRLRLRRRYSRFLASPYGVVQVALSAGARAEVLGVVAGVTDRRAHAEWLRRRRRRPADPGPDGAPVAEIASLVVAPGLGALGEAELLDAFGEDVRAAGTRRIELVTTGGDGVLLLGWEDAGRHRDGHGRTVAAYAPAGPPVTARRIPRQSRHWPLQAPR